MSRTWQAARVIFNPGAEGIHSYNEADRVGKYSTRSMPDCGSEKDSQNRRKLNRSCSWIPCPRIHRGGAFQALGTQGKTRGVCYHGSVACARILVCDCSFQQHLVWWFQTRSEGVVLQRGPSAQIAVEKTDHSMLGEMFDGFPSCNISNLGAPVWSADMIKTLLALHTREATDSNLFPTLGIRHNHDPFLEVYQALY